MTRDESEILLRLLRESAGCVRIDSACVLIASPARPRGSRVARAFLAVSPPAPPSRRRSAPIIRSPR